MILALDIGNTRIKAAVFEGNRLLEAFAFAADVLENNIETILQLYPTVTDLVVSSVSEPISKRLAGFENLIRITILGRNSLFPFINLYQSAETLGIDRMVLASAAVLEYPKKDRLVVDAGTCITYDFVDSNDNYHGGGISPGIALRYQSMHNFTAALPLLKAEEPTNFVGTTTAQSMHSGVVNGTAFEIDGFIDAYRKLHPNIIIILTGGDAVFLANRLKNTIFANSNFLLGGLVQTFQYKLQND